MAKSARSGRPRRVLQARQEFTGEAYHILEAAATVVLHNMGMLGREFVTKEDLISVAWETTFFYLKTPEEIKRRLFVWAQIAMARYVIHRFRPSRHVSIDPLSPDDPALQVASGRELDDPAVASALLEELQGLSPREQELVYQSKMGGASIRSLGRRCGRTSERVRQIIRDVHRRAARAGEL